MYFKIAQDNPFYNDHSILVKGASQFMLESDDDVASLPGKDGDNKVSVGSKAICITSGKGYVLCPTLGWTEFKGSAVMN